MGYYFGGTNLFHANHAGRRRAIDIEWRTEEDRPNVGRYRMRSFLMAEVGPSPIPRRRRRAGGELEVLWQNTIAEFQTVSRMELVAELEAWLMDDKAAERHSTSATGSTH